MSKTKSKKSKKNNNYKKQNSTVKEHQTIKTGHRIGAMVLVIALIIGMIAMYGLQ
ncbi:MAG: hypothetical protein PHI94_01235 [Eubacteriaceae bacterium]|nr:hypothetical protein [Eubacteriaceae bacterium]MDD4508154.1 hypothetical protein [Eubacteriaceae bacterium]